MTERLDIPIGGMTCAGCARSVERALNELDGVTATVNFATETATAEFDGSVVSPGRLAAAIGSAGYTANLPAADSGPGADGHEHHDPDALGMRLLVSTLLALPVLLMSMIPALQFDRWQWLALQLATAVVFWGAWPIHRGALAALRHRSANMDSLISIGTLAAWGWSMYALFFGHAGMEGMTMPFSLTSSREDAGGELYLEVAAVVPVFVLLGRRLEARAKGRAASALHALLELGAKEATLISGDGAETLVPIDRLAVGDLFVVRPGEKVATDGVVTEGVSAVDESLISGEPVPVEKHAGDPVTGGSINAGGRLVVEATAVGADTMLAGIARLVTEAQTGKAPIERLADRVAAVFVPVVIVLSLATLGFWLAAGEPATFAFSAAVAVLVVACPCALGLATPTALLVGTGRGAQLGLLIRGPEILERTKRADTIVLDKTGTLTEGRMTVSGLFPVAGVSEEELLDLAAAAETGSEHPIGRAIVSAAQSRGIQPAPASRFSALAGAGVEATVGEIQIAIGAADTSRTEVADALAGGATVVAVERDGEQIGAIALSDRIKPTAAAAIGRFRHLGLEPVLLTGDHELPATAVAHSLGIDRVLAGVAPEGKAAAVASLQRGGRVVAMVGDGVNDAPALAQADLGISIGTGTDVAIEASDLTLVSGDPEAAADAIALSRRTLRTIRQNLAWALGYNVLMLPLAAAGILGPVPAAAAMALSSVSVVANALRLRRFEPVATTRSAA
ncbi:MAG: heavy metal translocating P-type ATPase [Baekduia sp.]